jgi:hypothetical protein
MKTNNFIRALTIGFIATFIMSSLGFFLHRLGIPHLDWGILFSYLGVGILFGYFLLLFAGTVISLLFAYFFHPRLPGNSWKRGLFFATILWLLTGLFLTPSLGLGFFMGGLSIAFGTLLTYMIYGSILGFLYDA